ncbi:MAG TPA: FAD-dependent oxidoreductase, partial [Lachnospiraceae bacterium]|nr:FAD-dependent oxidoreductase [Lachnospiraceae bacterium]
GIKASFLSEIPISLKVKAAERFDNQAQFHPRKYLLALSKEISGDGSYLFENSRVVDLHEGNPVTLITENSSKITAGSVIIATHFPFYGGSSFYFARMYAEMDYALGISIKEKFPGGMYVSAESPGRSLRSTPFEDGELVIVVGEHHKTGHGDINTNVHYKNLIEFAKETYEVDSIPYRWSTQDYTTLDDIPYIGKISKGTPNIYIATGFKKWGITNGTASALILKDLIVKGESPWAPVFNPLRFEADPMIKSFVTTNLDVAKHLIGDKLKSAPDGIDINRGEGKVVEIDGEKMGTYKDDNGKLHLVDITCTHMGCTLNWNAAALTWDCPCHASRFTYDGAIIDGPALKPLTTDDTFKFNP